MRMRLPLAVSVVAAALAVPPPASAAPAWSGVGGTINGKAMSRATNPALSSDGRVVAFEAQFGDGTINQIAAYDRKTRRLTLVSKPVTGAFADGYSMMPRISGDGRYVLFWSGATNLRAADKKDSDSRKVFVRDLRLGRTTRLFQGVQGWSADLELSRDGRYAFLLKYTTRPQNVMGVPTTGSDVVGLVYRADLRTGRSSLLRLTDPAGKSIDVATNPGFATSRDGRYVAFFSDSSGETPLVTTASRLFVADVVTGKTREIPLWDASAAPLYGAPAPIAMDDAGTTIAFGLNDLRYDDRRLWVVDVRKGSVKTVPLPTAVTATGLTAVSGNGRTVVVVAHSLTEDPLGAMAASDLMAYDVPTGKMSKWLEAGQCQAQGALASFEHSKANCPVSSTIPSLTFDGAAVAVSTLSARTADDKDTEVDVYVATGR